MKPSILFSLCALLLAVPALAASIQVTAPASACSWKLNATKTIQWNFSGIDAAAKVRIILWRGGDKIGTIATQLAIGANGQGSYSWKVGSLTDAAAAAPGSGYFVKVRTTDDTASAQSGTFSILKDVATLDAATTHPGSYYKPAQKPQQNFPAASSAQMKMIQVTQPKAGAVLAATGTYPIHWSFVNIPESDVTLTLLRAGEPIGTPTGEATESKEFYWNLALQPPDPGTYKIAVETLDHAHRGHSGSFIVDEQGAIEPQFPSQGMLFMNGSSQEVKWKRVGNIQKLDLTLKKADSGWEQTLAAGVDAKLEKMTVVLNPGVTGQYKIEFKYTVDGGHSYVYSGKFNIQVTP